jgi:hypothetical protein
MKSYGGFELFGKSNETFKKGFLLLKDGIFINPYFLVNAGESCKSL